MAEPGSTQVTHWRIIFRQWFAAMGAWLPLWALVGAGNRQEGYWTFQGTAWLPFAPADFPILSRALAHPGREGEDALGGMAWRELLFCDATTQCGCAAAVWLGPLHGFDGAQRPERGFEWSCVLGSLMEFFRPSPDAFQGMGAELCSRRLKEFVERTLGGFLPLDANYRIDFSKRRIKLYFEALLPFSSENSWRFEGRGLARREYVDAHPGEEGEFQLMPTSDMGTQTEDLPGLDDEHAVGREVVDILAYRNDHELPEQTNA